MVARIKRRQRNVRAPARKPAGETPAAGAALIMKRRQRNARAPAQVRSGGLPAAASMAPAMPITDRGAPAGAALMPLDYLLQVMRDPTATAERRLRAAAVAAPLVHPALFVAPRHRSRAR